jgi:hypothetical protein
LAIIEADCQLRNVQHNAVHMKTRVTFRVAADLAEALRDLPNQTQFVEQALREALRDECSMCGGTGRARAHQVRVSNFRAASLPPLRREVAVQLKSIVTLARRTAATNVELRAANNGLSFVLARGSQVLLEGTLATAGSRLGRSSERS